MKKAEKIFNLKGKAIEELYHKKPLPPTKRLGKLALLVAGLMNRRWYN